ncbi:hypothetical protein HDU88_001352 [Geranomyces variabilis]|nr:hypothetical protein HDU88_001352 [Geranomyces variabilis]
MDAPPASPRARKDSSRRVSEAVRSLRQNLDRRYLAQPEVVRPVSSKVRRQIAAFENPASALDRVEKASLSVRGTIAAFERSDSGASTIEPPSTNAPPMTPSRKAAIAARKVTRSQKLLVPEPDEDTGVPEPGQCSTPRVWPEVRHRKALFESNLSNNNTDLASQPNEKRNAKMSAGKKQKTTSLRKNQRLESSAPVVNADDNGVEQVEGVNEQEPAADMMDVDEAPVSTPNPFIDVDEVEAATVVPSSGIFAAVPASPARKSKRVASRTAPATMEPEATLAPIANPTTENEHPENVALPKQTMTVTDGVTHPAPTLTPRTPTKVVMPTSEQKAAIKTPVKSARKSARKLRAEESSTAPTPGTPSKVAFPERMESALADAPEQQEIEEEPVAPSSVRKSARKTRAVHTAVEEDSATLAPSVPTTPSKAKRAASASEVTAAAEQTTDEPPTTPRSVRKSARKPPAAAEIPATTPNRVTFAQRLESAALQEDTHEPAVVASPARKSARKPQTPRAVANESETLSAGAGNPATPNRVTFAQRLDSAALHDTQHEPAAVATPARKSARKSQTPRGGAAETARPATTPSKVTFSRSLDESSSDEDAAAEPRPKVPATPARVSARLAAASPHSARHAEPAVMPPATPAASTEITAEESFQTAPVTPTAVAETTAVAAPASTKRKRNARDDDNDKQDNTTADAIAPAAESATTAPTAEEASSSTEAAAPVNTTPAAQPFVRKRRRMLEILPTPKKKTASSSLAPSSAARRIVQQHKSNVALPAVDSPPRNWVSTPVSPLGSSVVQMDVDGEDEVDDEEEGEEEGEGGWLLSVFFKAARKVGLL